MGRAISAFTWEVSWSEVPFGVGKAQTRWGVVWHCSLRCMLPVLHPPEPMQGTKPGKTHCLWLLIRVIFLAQVLWAPAGTREASGQTLGVAAPHQGGCPPEQGDVGIAAAAHHGAQCPGWTFPSVFLLWCGVTGAQIHDVRSRWPLPGERAGYRLFGCGVVARFGAWR